MKLKSLISIPTVMLLGLSINAQEVVVPTGGETSGLTGGTSYTIGQIVHHEIVGNTGSLKEGVQHRYTISSNKLPKTDEISLLSTIYPNPTQDHLVLKIDIASLEEMAYIIYDTSGKDISNGKIKTSETSIDMSDCIRNSYFLKVVRNNRVIKTFTIIKK